MKILMALWAKCHAMLEKFNPLFWEVYLSWFLGWWMFLNFTVLPIGVVYSVFVWGTEPSPVMGKVILTIVALFTLVALVAAWVIARQAAETDAGGEWKWATEESLEAGEKMIVFSNLPGFLYGICVTIYFLSYRLLPPR